MAKNIGDPTLYGITDTGIKTVVGAGAGSLVADCNGTADNVEIQAAIDALTAARTWIETVKLIGTFTCAAAITLPSYTCLDRTDAIINWDVDSSGGFFSATGSLGVNEALSAPGSVHDAYITVADGTTFAIDNYIHIIDTVEDGFGYDRGEIHRVVYIHGNDLYLDNPLWRAYAAATTTVSVANMVHHVDIIGGELLGTDSGSPYVTGDTALSDVGAATKIMKLVGAFVNSESGDGVKVSAGTNATPATYYIDTVDSDDQVTLTVNWCTGNVPSDGVFEAFHTKQVVGLNFNYVADFSVKDARFHNLMDRATSFTNCVNGEISGNKISGSKRIGVGYGIAYAGATANLNVHENTIAQCRHATTGGGQSTTGSPSFCLFGNNTIIGSPTDPHYDSNNAFDVHLCDARGLQFNDNIISGCWSGYYIGATSWSVSGGMVQCGNSAIQNRGDNGVDVRLSNIHVKSNKYGIYWDSVTAVGNLYVSDCGGDIIRSAVYINSSGTRVHLDNIKRTTVNASYKVVDNVASASLDAQDIFDGSTIHYSMLKTGLADQEYTGLTVEGVAGAALVFGNSVYLQTGDSRWELVDANVTATAILKLGICVFAAAGDASVTRILLDGNVRADAVFPALTIGAPVYVGETAGDIVVAAPVTASTIVRIVGHGNTANELYFHPSNDWIETAA